MSRTQYYHRPPVRPSPIVHTVHGQFATTPLQINRTNNRTNYSIDQTPQQIMQQHQQSLQQQNGTHGRQGKGNRKETTVNDETISSDKHAQRIKKAVNRFVIVDILHVCFILLF